jgi:TRAP-type C4-dicarboxylate transport system substrate-binding protein
VISDDEVLLLFERADPARSDDVAPVVDSNGHLAALRTRSSNVTLIDTEPTPTRPDARHRWVLVVAAAAIMAIVVGAVVLAVRSDSTDNVAVPTEATARPPGTEGAPTPTAPPASSVAPSAAPPATIPDGVYRRVATVAEGEAMGLDPQLVRDMVGPDGQTPIAFEISGDSWTHLVTNDAGIEEVGDRGTSSYDEQGRWVQTNQSGSFPYLWELRDGVLSIQPDYQWAEAQGIEVADDVRFNTEGDFVLDESGPSDDVVLTFASPFADLPEQITAFATDVTDRSRRSIAFDGDSDDGAEAGIIADVESGAVDIAWVGTRAFPEFDPLMAPLLVDSYDLQSAVYEAGIPARLGESLAARGLQPIAVLPGPLVKMLGVDQALVRLEDFAGARVAAMPSDLSRSTSSALGAEAIDARPQMPLDGLDGLATQLGSVAGNSYQQQAHSVTANLNIAPRDLVVVMNARRFAELTPEQQDILLAAGEAAAQQSDGVGAREDERVGPELCDSPMQVLEADPEDLQAIEQALGPVYAEIESDVGAAEALAEIRAIKQAIGAPPATLTC